MFGKGHENEAAQGTIIIITVLYEAQLSTGRSGLWVSVPTPRTGGGRGGQYFGWWGRSLLYLSFHGDTGGFSV